MDKKTFLCLIVFTLICTLTILFIHHFTTFSPISIAYDINPTNYMDKAITIDNIRNITAYANHYAVPASLFAFIFVMLCGLFLFNLLVGDPDYTLLILAAASICFAVNSISSAQGYMFMHPLLKAFLSNRYIIPFSIVLMIIFILLNKDNYFMRYFIYINITASLVLLFRYLLCLVSSIFIPEWTYRFIEEFPYSLFHGLFRIT